MLSMPVCVLAKWPTSGEGGKEEPQGATHALDMSSHGQRRHIELSLELSSLAEIFYRIK